MSESHRLQDVPDLVLSVPCSPGEDLRFLSPHLIPGEADESSSVCAWWLCRELERRSQLNVEFDAAETKGTSLYIYRLQSTTFIQSSHFVSRSWWALASLPNLKPYANIDELGTEGLMLSLAVQAAPRSLSNPGQCEVKRIPAS